MASMYEMISLYVMLILSGARLQRYLRKSKRLSYRGELLFLNSHDSGEVGPYVSFRVPSQETRPHSL